MLDPPFVFLLLAILIPKSTSITVRGKGYEFAADVNTVVGEIHQNFTCEGKSYGYYADQFLDCKVFHICSPVLSTNGVVTNTLMFSFFCPETTRFSQDSRTCIAEQKALPCHRAHTLYTNNNAIGIVPKRSWQRPSSSFQSPPQTRNDFHLTNKIVEDDSPSRPFVSRHFESSSSRDFANDLRGHASLLHDGLDSSKFPLKNGLDDDANDFNREWEQVDYEEEFDQINRDYVDENQFTNETPFSTRGNFANEKSTLSDSSVNLHSRNHNGNTRLNENPRRTFDSGNSNKERSSSFSASSDALSNNESFPDSPSTATRNAIHDKSLAQSNSQRTSSNEHVRKSRQRSNSHSSGDHFTPSSFTQLPASVEGRGSQSNRKFNTQTSNANTSSQSNDLSSLKGIRQPFIQSNQQHLDDLEEKKVNEILSTTQLFPPTKNVLNSHHRGQNKSPLISKQQSLNKHNLLNAKSRITKNENLNKISQVKVSPTASISNSEFLKPHAQTTNEGDEQFQNFEPIEIGTRVVEPVSKANQGSSRGIGGFRTSSRLNSQTAQSGDNKNPVKHQDVVSSKQSPQTSVFNNEPSSKESFSAGNRASQQPTAQQQGNVPKYSRRVPNAKFPGAASKKSRKVNSVQFGKDVQSNLNSHLKVSSNAFSNSKKSRTNQIIAKKKKEFETSNVKQQKEKSESDFEPHEVLMPPPPLFKSRDSERNSFIPHQTPVLTSASHALHGPSPHVDSRLQTINTFKHSSIALGVDDDGKFEESDYEWSLDENDHSLQTEGDQFSDDEWDSFSPPLGALSLNANAATNRGNAWNQVSNTGASQLNRGNLGEGQTYYVTTYKPNLSSSKTETNPAISDAYTTIRQNNPSVPLRTVTSSRQWQAQSVSPNSNLNQSNRRRQSVTNRSQSSFNRAEVSEVDDSQVLAISSANIEGTSQLSNSEGNTLRRNQTPNRSNTLFTESSVDRHRPSTTHRSVASNASKQRAVNRGRGSKKFRPPTHFRRGSSASSNVNEPSVQSSFSTINPRRPSRKEVSTDSLWRNENTAKTSSNSIRITPKVSSTRQSKVDAGENRSSQRGFQNIKDAIHHLKVDPAINNQVNKIEVHKVASKVVIETPEQLPVDFRSGATRPPQPVVDHTQNEKRFSSKGNSSRNADSASLRSRSGAFKDVDERSDGKKLSSKNNEPQSEVKVTSNKKSKSSSPLSLSGRRIGLRNSRIFNSEESLDLNDEIIIIDLPTSPPSLDETPRLKSGNVRGRNIHSLTKHLNDIAAWESRGALPRINASVSSIVGRGEAEGERNVKKAQSVQGRNSVRNSIGLRNDQVGDQQDQKPSRQRRKRIKKLGRVRALPSSSASNDFTAPLLRSKVDKPQIDQNPVRVVFSEIKLNNNATVEKQEVQKEIKSYLPSSSLKGRGSRRYSSSKNRGRNSGTRRARKVVKSNSANNIHFNNKIAQKILSLLPFPISNLPSAPQNAFLYNVSVKQGSANLVDGLGNRISTLNKDSLKQIQNKEKLGKLNQNANIPQPFASETEEPVARSINGLSGTSKNSNKPNRNVLGRTTEVNVKEKPIPKRILKNKPLEKESSSVKDVENSAATPLRNSQRLQNRRRGRFSERVTPNSAAREANSEAINRGSESEDGNENPVLVAKEISDHSLAEKNVTRSISEESKEPSNLSKLRSRTRNSRRKVGRGRTRTFDLPSQLLPSVRKPSGNDESDQSRSNKIASELPSNVLNRLQSRRKIARGRGLSERKNSNSETTKVENSSEVPQNSIPGNNQQATQRLVADKKLTEENPEQVTNVSEDLDRASPRNPEGNRRVVKRLRGKRRKITKRLSKINGLNVSEKNDRSLALLASSDDESEHFPSKNLILRSKANVTLKNAQRSALKVPDNLEISESKISTSSSKTDSLSKNLLHSRSVPKLAKTNEPEGRRLKKAFRKVKIKTRQLPDSFNHDKERKKLLTSNDDAAAKRSASETISSVTKIKNSSRSGLQTVRIQLNSSKNDLLVEETVNSNRELRLKEQQSKQSAGDGEVEKQPLSHPIVPPEGTTKQSGKVAKKTIKTKLLARKPLSKVNSDNSSKRENIPTSTKFSKYSSISRGSKDRTSEVASKKDNFKVIGTSIKSSVSVNGGEAPIGKPKITISKSSSVSESSSTGESRSTRVVGGPKPSPSLTKTSVETTGVQRRRKQEDANTERR